MLSPQFHQVLAPRVKILNTIWGVFLAAGVFYVVIAWIMFGQAGGADEVPAETSAPRGMMQAIAAAVALTSLTASIFVERFQLAPSRLQAFVTRVPLVDAVFPSNQLGRTIPDPELARVYESLSDTEKRLAGLGNPYQTTQIMVWAMREAIVLIGLVLAIMLGSFTAILPFAVVGVAAVALKVPRPAGFIESQRDLAQKFS